MPTKYYTFDTEREAEDYNQAVTALHNFDTTKEWCKPMKGKKWAVIASDKLSIEGKVRQTLSNTFFE